jgi:hypothetical protein
LGDISCRTRQLEILPYVFEKLGGRTRARTWDPLIKSQLLYQLSYAPGTRPEKVIAGGRRVAKRHPHVQQGKALWASVFPSKGLILVNFGWLGATATPAPEKHPGSTG